MTEQENKFAVVTTVPGFMTSADIISKLRQKYHGVVYDVSTTKGLESAQEARKELKDARLALDKKKPEVTREALDFCAKVEADYKALRAAVVECEDIPAAAIKAEEERREKERQAKIEVERARIAGIIASVEVQEEAERLAAEAEALRIEKEAFAEEQAKAQAEIDQQRAEIRAQQEAMARAETRRKADETANKEMARLFPPC